MSPSLPRLGVVILNWNGKEHLEKCLPSVLASDHPDFFVVVVDNDSADGSVEWLEAAYPHSDFPDVHTVVLSKNLLFAGGNNAGAVRALALGAEILLLLNNDTTVDPSAFRHLAESFAADERVGIAGPRIVFAERPGRIWYGGGILRMNWGLIQHRAIRSRVEDGRDLAGATDWVSGCALAIRSELWERLSGLDDSYYIYVEDVDLCVRAARLGASIRYCPEALVLHEVSASVGGGASAFKSYHKSRSALRLFGRHAQPWQWPGVLFGRGLYDGLSMLWLAARGHLRAAAAVTQAWFDAFLHRVGYPVPSKPERGS